MSLQVGIKMDAHAADGYYGKKDLAADAKDMLDGRGITPTEKKIFFNRIGKMVQDPRVKVTQTAQDAAAHLVQRMATFDSNKQVHAPDLDKGEIKSILALYVDRSRASSSEHSSGGGGGRTPGYGDPTAPVANPRPSGHRVSGTEHR